MNVYVGDLYPNRSYSPRCVAVSCIYGITRRGLTALLILGEGQCEGLKSGMGEGRISHAFFVSVHFQLNQPRQGERVGRE